MNVLFAENIMLFIICIKNLFVVKFTSIFYFDEGELSLLFVNA